MAEQCCTAGRKSTQLLIIAFAPEIIQFTVKIQSEPLCRTIPGPGPGPGPGPRPGSGQ